MEQYNQNNLQQPNTLVWGILSLVFSSILGIIFGAIGLSKSKKFVAEGGELVGKAKVGKILSLVGIILGIVVTIIIVIEIIVVIAAGNAAVQSYNMNF